jgi:hypothetical protein
MTFSITTLYHYAEYHNVKCHVLFVVMLSFVMLNVVLLSFIMLNVILLRFIMLSDVMLSNVMLNDVMLSAVMLSVLAPNKVLEKISIEICNLFQSQKTDGKTCQVYTEEDKIV